MQFYRPNLDRTLTYVAPYVSVKDQVLPISQRDSNPARWRNTLRCNRIASETLRVAPKDACVTCTKLEPFFNKSNNYLNARGTNYRDVRFTGDEDTYVIHGCLDPRDALFDSVANVHCQDMCAGKLDRAPCCLTLDLNVLDEDECEMRRKAAADALAAQAEAAKNPQPEKRLANYPPLNKGLKLEYAYGAPVFMLAMNQKNKAGVELIK